MEKGKKKLLVTLLILLLVILAGCVGAALYFFTTSEKETKTYQKKIASAEKYLSKGDYENAVLSYQAAIDEAPEKTDAYIALAELYEEQNDLSSAQKVLKQGKIKTNSAKISKLLDQLKAQMESVATLADGETKETTAPLEEVDPAEASKDTTLNASLAQKLGSYTYADFSRDYSSYDSAEVEGDALALSYTSAGITCYYSNTDKNTNAVSLTQKKPSDTAVPTMVKLQDVSVLFNKFNGAVSLERLESMIGRVIDVKTDEERSYVEFTYADCLFKIETDTEGNIVKSDAWNELTPLSTGGDSTTEYAGVVVDAVTGSGVANAELTFKATDNSKKTTKTGSDGTFKIEIENGSYELTITCDEYIEETFDVEITDANRTGDQYTISPELAAGEVRIVLEWEATPKDLDSYLFGELDSGDDVYVSYRNTEETIDGEIVAELDVDCTSGYGPETTTIHDLNGVYTFLVADFNRTGTMGKTKATVKVYMPGESSPTVIEVDSSIEDQWEVFEIDHGELKVLNEAGSRGWRNSNK